ncbi:S1C family serine protease [Bacillus sp. MMSF_3328]|uniref:S1C family serine protease n=1 Tax=Bacillus TaxID=1386 RepID=UPI00273DED6C|nr:trypsin-like peptidase domain-containing protein [Bacillus sp. MMSF_3328]
MMDSNDKYNQEETKSKLRKGKGILSVVAAGVVGSALTLYAAPYTDYIRDQFPQAAASQDVSGGQASSAADANKTGIIPEQTSAHTEGSLADIVEGASKAIVGIVKSENRANQFSNTSQTVESGSGSGVIFKKENGSAYILTNNHVVEGASKIDISLHDGQKTTAELVGADALTDLAVLRMDEKYADTLLGFGDSSKLRPGDQVLAIGNPLGLDLSRTVTQGIVSAVDRSISVDTSAGSWDMNVIQTDAAINPGNSGGALINTAGEVIGINSLKISESGVEGLGFAIPSNDLQPIVEEIMANGNVERPYAGVGLAGLQEVPQGYLQNLPQNVTKGAFIANIDPESAAAKAGLKTGDVIIAINDTEIGSPDDFRKYLYTKLKTGDKAELSLYRNGEKMNITMELGTKTITD